jgi:hypothetical protein
MSPREAALVGVDLCHALAAIHRAGLLHRDIKPNNVMRAEGGRIVLMDFGSGRHIPAGDELPPDVAGTPLYLAPELFKREPPSIASDVYSLGVLLFHLVTGDYPVRGHDRRALLLAHEAGERQSLRDARPDLPPAFVEVIERAVAVNFADRYPSAGAFGGALAGLAGVPFKPEPLALSRRMRWSVAAGLGAAALVVLAAVVERNIRRDERSSPIPDTQSSVGLAGAGRSPAAARAGAYQINAALYAKRDGQDVPLTTSSRVAPGDKLFLTVEASRPVFVYIINQDDKGAWFRLFPIPGLALTNPVPAGGRHRFPGLMEGEEFFWQVTSPGGREHFLVFAAPERLTAFEELFARIPPAEVGRPVGEVPLSAQAVDVLRGIGGLASGQPSSNASGALAFAELRPLATGVETADGLWARQITVQNPDP